MMDPSLIKTVTYFKGVAAHNICLEIINRI